MSYEGVVTQCRFDAFRRTTIANRLLAAWLLVDAVRCASWLTHGSGYSDAIMAAGLLLLVRAVWGRSMPHATLATPFAWVVTIGSLVAPLLYCWVPWTPDDLFTKCIRLSGAMLFLFSAWSLRDCFSVLPQLRRLVTTGAYRWIRHPMYLAYLVMDAAYWIPTNAPRARGIWLLEAVLLCTRAAIEERCLRQERVTRVAPIT